MQWDGKKLSLFANGEKVGSTRYNPNPQTGLSYHGTDPLKVAAATWDPVNGHVEYLGALSDLRIYSRALTDREVQDTSAGH
jgi:hypothetical protein